MVKNVVLKSLAVGAVVAVSVLGTAAKAEDIHFAGNDRERCSGADLLIQFQVAGLGDGQTVTVTASGWGNRVCTVKGNNGNYDPNDPPGQEEFQLDASVPVTGTGNGNVKASVTLKPEDYCNGTQSTTMTYYSPITLRVWQGSTIYDTMYIYDSFVCSQR